jgi:transcriptional regulator with XRE-family HTH domain
VLWRQSTVQEPKVRADRLRARRQELRLTQEQLSEQTGVTQSTISQLERGEQIPTLRSLVVLAKALDVPIDWLLGVEADRSGEAISSTDTLEAEIIEQFRRVDPSRQQEVADLFRAIVNLCSKQP